MGIGFQNIVEFFGADHVPRAAKVLDIGTANMSGVTAEGVVRFVKRFNDVYDETALQEWARFMEAGGQRYDGIGGIDGAWLGDLLTRAGMDYTAFDIFAGYRTVIVDLNTAELGPAHKGQYDAVFNFGTTEHVFNQYNAFKIIHDALKVGGVVWHQVPQTDLDHGFFNYNPMALVSIAEANGYEIMKLSTGGEKAAQTIRAKYDARYRKYMGGSVTDHDGWASIPIPTSGIGLMARKLKAEPFRLGLDTTTTGATVVSDIVSAYGSAHTKHDGVVKPAFSIEDARGVLTNPDNSEAGLKHRGRVMSTVTVGMEIPRR